MMVRELVLVAFFGLVPTNGSVVGVSAVEPGTYESIAAVGNLTKIHVAVESDMMTSLHFFPSGMTLPISVGPHKTEPDEAGCLVYSQKKLLERRLLTRNFEKLKESRPDIFAPHLDWRDIRVCPTRSGILILLVFDGKTLLLRKADGVLPGGSAHVHVEAPERARHHETAGDAPSRSMVTRGFQGISDTATTATSQVSNSSDLPAGGSETISGRRWAGRDKGHGHSIVSGVPGKKRAATGNLSSGPLKRSRRQPKSRIEPKLAGRPPPPGIYHNVFPILVFTKVTMNLTTDLECQFKFWIPGLATPVLVGPHRIVASLLDDCYMFDHRDNVALGRTTWAFRHLSDELALRRLPGMSSVDLEVCTSPLLQVDLVIKKRRYPMRFGEATRLVLTGSKTALKSFLQNRGHQSDYGKDLPLFAGANDWPLEELMQGSQASYLPDDMLNEVVYNDLSWSPSDLSAGFFDLIENVGGTEAGASTRALGASGEEMLHRPAGYQAFGN